MKANEIPEWKMKFNKRLEENKKNFELLTEIQQDAIKSAQRNMKNAVEMLQECNDLYVSDVNKLAEAQWKLYEAFRTE